jgi:hypothetical protein
MSRDRREEREFFVGYLPVPAALSRFLRGAAIALAALAMVVALALAAAQRPLGSGSYEFGVDRALTGALRLEPVPALWVAGEAAAAGEPPALRIVPLVGEGKRGLGAALSALAGREVRLTGRFIRRAGVALFEVSRGEVTGEGAAPVLASAPLGRATLAGEIVDSKCWLGVMKPAEGKSHKDCAIRCISGGAPAALVVRDGRGGAAVLLLVGEDGSPLGRELLDVVGEPVEVEGEALRVGNLALFATSRGRVHRIGS